nr:hypothetical protein Iba_chr05fCG10040 [Ipomoea batatas]
MSPAPTTMNVGKKTLNQVVSSLGEHNRERRQRANKLASSPENPKHPKKTSTPEIGTQARSPGSLHCQARHHLAECQPETGLGKGNSSSAPDDPVATEEVVEETQSLSNQNVLARIDGGDFRQGGNDFLLNLRNGSLRHRNQHILIIFLQEL